MSDTNEEQLLSDLLSGIAREDANLDAAHLEVRVMSAIDAPATVRLKRDTTDSMSSSFGATGVRRMVFAAAAAILIAVLVPAIFWLRPALHRETPDVKVVEATEQTVAESANGAKPSLQTRPTRRANPTNLTNPTNPTNPTLPTLSSDEFVPLMPLTEQELSGPFQIVRVQMPRASLGALRSPLEQPNELIEADVLLGEDGMARAIRVSASGSVYPWRSR